MNALGTAPPRQVLIAEDEVPIAEVVAMIVEAAGYEAVVAAHGQQALELARARWPALLITDLMMPYLTGAELIANLRAEATAGGRDPLPVILMTAASSRVAQAAGAEVVLSKPFQLEELEQLVQRFLSV